MFRPESKSIIPALLLLTLKWSGFPFLVPIKFSELISEFPCNDQASAEVLENKNLLPWIEKEKILKNLSLGITDIIHQYSRTDWDSVQDNHIIPSAYSDIIALVEHTKVDQLLFVYKNAARWFLHSLNHKEPVSISKLKDQIELGVFHKIKLADRTIECILMPSPLNRGEAGQTLPFKLKYYKEIIKA